MLDNSLLFHYVPCVAIGRDGHGKDDRIIVVETITARAPVLSADDGVAGESRVVKRQTDCAGNGFGQGVVEHGKATLGESGINVNEPVPVARIGTAQMDDVAVEDVAMLLVPADDVAHSLARLFRIVQTRATITSLHAAAVVLEHQRLVDIEMLAEGLDDGG